MNHAAVQEWLDRYVKAWLTYDEQLIGDLFSEDAAYFCNPYDTPILGRTAIVTSWMKNRDAPGTYKAAYHPVLVEENTAVANGHSIYLEGDGETVRTEFNNIFMLKFDGEGRCKEFTDWYMEKPE